MKSRRQIKDGADAVFLPGKIHGCEDQIYIIYLNDQGNNERGCFEIEILDYERILMIYDEVEGNAEAFFSILPDRFQGEWYYCNSGTPQFKEYVKEYFNADFICGRDGGIKEELEFLITWAREQKYK